MAASSGIDNPTVPGHAFMPAPTKIRAPHVPRGKVTKVPKSMTVPKLRTLPKLHAPSKSRRIKDSTRLHMPREKAIK